MKTRDIIIATVLAVILTGALFASGKFEVNPPHHDYYYTIPDDHWSKQDSIQSMPVKTYIDVEEIEIAITSLRVRAGHNEIYYDLFKRYGFADLFKGRADAYHSAADLLQGILDGSTEEDGR